jgi:hypothetical protein
VVDVVPVLVRGDGGLRQEAATARALVGLQVQQRLEVLPVEVIELRVPGGDRLDQPASIVVPVRRGLGGLPTVEPADRDPERECRLYLPPLRRRLRELAS